MKIEKEHRKSTLMSWNKEQLTEHIMRLEYNNNVLHDTIDTQAANCKKLLDKEWIPADERLPKPHVDVLVAVIDVADGTGDASTFVDCLVDNNGTLTWSTFNGAQESVPAWMPLPEPYKREEENNG